MPGDCGDDMTCGDFWEIFRLDSLFLKAYGRERRLFVGPKLACILYTPVYVGCRGSSVTLSLPFTADMGSCGQTFCVT
jgi:hypothetical protein